MLGKLTFGQNVSLYERSSLDRVFGQSFSDLKLEAIRRYDLVHASDDPTLPAISGRKDADIARPAKFLIDSSGMIRWRMVVNEP